MNILLDTHVVIWWYEDPLCLKDEARKIIEDKGKCFVSKSNSNLGDFNKTNP